MMKIYCAPRGETSGSAAVRSLLERAFRNDYVGAFPVIKKTPNGKPYFPGRPEVHFSLSHTKTHVLCAISDVPVGADIEAPRNISARAIGFFCSPEELSIFDPLDLWVLKESCVKLFGGTLTSVKNLRFSRSGDSIYLIANNDYRLSAAGYISSDKNVVSSLYSFDNCRAAVSCFGGKLPTSIELI